MILLCGESCAEWDFLNMEKKFAKTAYRSYVGWGVCSSMSVTMCTIIDAALIGNFVGSRGLAVAGIVTPVFMLYALLGVTVGTGANVMIGRALGAADREEAGRIMGKQLFIGLTVGIGLLVLSFLFRDTVIRFLGAKEELTALTTAYLMPVFLASPLFVLYHMLSLSVRTDGDSALAAAASAVVIVTNLALDFLFMGGLGWGIMGASVSLCISELLGFLLLLTHFFRKLSLLRLRLYVPVLSDVRTYIANGFGVGSTYIFQALVMLVFNRLLLSDPVNGVANEAIFGVLYTISTIPQAFFNGAGDAFAPVVSIFTGEQDDESILAVLRQGVFVTAVFGILAVAVFLLFAEPLLRIFGLSPAQMSAAAAALRLFSVNFLFVGFNILATAFWQSIGRARLAGVMSLLRNFALMLLIGGVLISRFQIMGLAGTYICSEALCLLFALLVLAVSPSKRYISGRYASAGRVFEKYYSIQKESVSQIAADIEELCDAWDIGAKQAFLLNFIVEEILLNIIKFGLKDRPGKHYIDIRLLEGGSSFTLCIRDDVKAYNPFTSEGDSIDNAVLDAIRKKTRYCDYQRKLVFNYLYLII